MTSPLQVLYFIAVTLAPPGTQHINVSSGSEVYAWDKGSKGDAADTWVYDDAIDPKQVLENNAIVPDNMSRAQKTLVKASHHNWAPHFIVAFDDAHQVQKTSQGYVYVVRPGAPNQKTFSFTFSR
jgi:hypothetical protein